MGTAEVVTVDTQWDIHTETHWQMWTNLLGKGDKCDIWGVSDFENDQKVP